MGRIFFRPALDTKSLWRIANATEALLAEQRRTNALLEAIGGAKRVVASQPEPWPPGTEWTRPTGQGAVHTGQHARFIHKGQLLIGRVASVGDAGVSVTVLSPPARGIYALDYGKFEVASW